MRTSWRNRLYGLGLGIGLFFFIGQILKGYQVFASLALNAASLLRLSGAVTAIVIALGLQVVAWRFLMWDLGVTLTWRSVVGGYMLSFLPRYIPGSVWGYLSRNEWLKRSYGVPYAISSVGSLLEIGVALFTGSAVIGLYFFLNTSGLIRLALLCFEVGLPLVSWFLLNLVFQIYFVKRRYATPDRPATFRVRFPVWGIAFALHFMSWICYGILILILSAQFNILPSVHPLTSATFSFCSSWLIGFLIVFFPSGLGVREIALSNVLTSVMGMLPDTASAISVLSRLCIAGAEVLWVSIGIMYSKKRKNTPRSARKG